MSAPGQRFSLREARPTALPHPAPKKLSEELVALRDRFAQGPLTLGEVIEVLQRRAWTLVLILLALPFVTPIPLPFLSTPFGLAIGLISLRLALGEKPWLPARLLTRPLPTGFFDSLLRFSTRILRFLEKFLRPRLDWFADTPSLVRVHALAMVVAAAVLLLPLPVPFTNAFPAWLIILISGGLLERDGIAIAAGYVVGICGAAYAYFLGEMALHLLEVIRRALGLA
ncbi:MAG: exopolysaccharide biosynthesis protein [Verrucomicrobia bacterium]|nr:MAG: exopolysaccharide biosynthesis protein [Verrucomicrobiota bacterium]